MNDYQQEQLEALVIVRRGLARMDESRRSALKDEIKAYQDALEDKEKFDAVMREMWPFIATQIVTLMFITYVPETTLWIPRFFGFL